MVYSRKIITTAAIREDNIFDGVTRDFYKAKKQSQWRCIFPIQK